MEFILNEHQFSILLENEKSSKLTSDMKRLHSFTVNLVSKIKRKFDLNFKFLVTWGTAIGGLVAPLDSYIREGEFELSDDSIALILIGIACTYFYQNKKELNKLIEKIKEEGLFEIFKKTLRKSEELRTQFADFMSSLNLTLGTTIEIIHYAFIIPIINDLIRISHGSGNSWDIAETIVDRLLASGVVLISGQVLLEVLNKLIKRLKNI